MNDTVDLRGDFLRANDSLSLWPVLARFAAVQIAALLLFAVGSL